jgi:iron(II)-dependent oxidoreductase
VIHVCYHEAEAFARWAEEAIAGTEWEVAASGSLRAMIARLSVGRRAAARRRIWTNWVDVATIDAYPSNISSLGCYGLLGDVWVDDTDFNSHPARRFRTRVLQVPLERVRYSARS